VRTLATRGEWMNLKVFALDKRPFETAKLFWRPLATGKFEEVPLTRVTRAVYTVKLKVRTDLEYYIQAETAEGGNFSGPPRAPQLNQTVLVWSP